MMMLAWLLPPAAAATTFTLVELSAQVSGTSVTASAVVRASAPTAVQAFGVCVRGASDANLDFWKLPATITTAGTTSPAQTRSFAPGTYDYFVCLYTSARWETVGRTTSFTVPAAGDAPTVPPVTPGTDSSDLPIGDLPGWHQTYRQDFSTDAAVGEVGRVYGQHMRGYDAVPDTSGRGRYTPDRVLSVSGGALRYSLHTENGRPLVAAPVPLGWDGQVYGRFSVRLRTNDTSGYKLSFLLWPTSNDWDEGEVDFPEGNLGHAPYGASVKKGSLTPQGNVSWDPDTVAVCPTDISEWHVATTEWRPGLVRWLWDGVEVGRTTSPATVPDTAFRWVLQAETSDWNVVPSPSSVGDVQVDWLTAYAYTG